MTNKALIILGAIVGGLVIISGTIWYLRSRETGMPLYNPFQSAVDGAGEVEYDPPSDFTSEYDQSVPAPAETDPSIIDHIALPAGLIQ